MRFQLKCFVIVLLFLFARATASSENHCPPFIPERCFDSAPIAECSTCCCSSSANVEFYEKDSPEPACSAKPAIYSVKFVGTRSLVCNPDYSPNGSLWSPVTGISHKPTYVLWDSCMRDVSSGVALVSQTGNTSVIEAEYRSHGSEVLDSFKGDLIPGDGYSNANFTVNCAHQYVSAITMLVPSVDRLVGVSLVRLCDGDSWKSQVKLCTELFSTATKSARVAAMDEPNSVQYGNCSLGYFEFTLLGAADGAAYEAAMCPAGSSTMAASVPAVLALSMMLLVAALFT